MNELRENIEKYLQQPVEGLLPTKERESHLSWQSGGGGESLVTVPSSISKTIMAASSLVFTTSRSSPIKMQVYPVQ